MKDTPILSIKAYLSSYLIVNIGTTFWQNFGFFEPNSFIFEHLQLGFGI